MKRFAMHVSISRTQAGIVLCAGVGLMMVWGAAAPMARRSWVARRDTSRLQARLAAAQSIVDAKLPARAGGAPAACAAADNEQTAMRAWLQELDRAS